MPVRRPLASPVVAPRSSYYHTTPRHDYSIDDSINRVEYVSNAILEDTYDQARLSKNRDNELIRNTRAAIISTEQHASPRSAAVSRRLRASTAPPASRPVSRPATVQPAAQSSSYTKVEEEQLQAWPSPAPRPFIVVVPNRRSSSPARASSKPVVVPRGGSVPPPEYAQRRARAVSVPPRPVSQSASALATSTLWAHRPYPLYKDVARRARAASLGPAPYRASSVSPAAKRASYYSYYGSATAEDVPSLLPTSGLHAHRPMVLKKDLVRLAKARADNYGRLARAASEPRDVPRASDYYYSVPAVRERALRRYLYAERALAGPTAKPKRVSLADFPQVYVPWTGQGPSNRSKAAIIGSRMEAEDAGAKKPPRRPRSQFAANKLREFKIQDLERRYK